MALRVYFFSESFNDSLTKRDICIQEGSLNLAHAILGGGNLNFPPSLGWAHKYVNIKDPVEVDLAGRLQNPTLARVAEYTSSAYVGPWNAFVLFCGSLDIRQRLHRDKNLTDALDLQYRMEKASSF